MPRDPKDHITLHPHAQHVVVKIHGAAVADTHAALELRENGHPPRQYLQRDDINMMALVPSETRTHCPYKGEAQYYSVRLDGHTITDAAWSYEQPYPAMGAISRLVAFDSDKLEQNIQA